MVPVRQRQPKVAQRPHKKKSNRVFPRPAIVIIRIEIPTREPKGPIPFRMIPSSLIRESARQPESQGLDLALAHPVVRDAEYLLEKVRPPAEAEGLGA